MDDIESEMTQLPPAERTVKGFLKSVNSRKDKMNVESGAAMLPIAGQKTVPTGVSQNIRNLAKSYMNNTIEGRRQAKYIIDRAAEYQKPWSYGELDQLRSDLAAQTAKHRAKDPVAKYASEKGDIDLQIDNAILDGLRDTVYPEMDRAAGRPQGYFADLKGRQSALITLQQILDKRVRRTWEAHRPSAKWRRDSARRISRFLSTSARHCGRACMESGNRCRQRER